MGQIQRLNLPEEVKAIILGENARQLFDLA